MSSGRGSIFAGRPRRIKIKTENQKFRDFEKSLGNKKYLKELSQKYKNMPTEDNPF